MGRRRAIKGCNLSSALKKTTPQKQARVAADGLRTGVLVRGLTSLPVSAETANAIVMTRTLKYMIRIRLAPHSITSSPAERETCVLQGYQAYPVHLRKRLGKQLDAQARRRVRSRLFLTYKHR